jgi:anthranilate phosphoribosyltransferase
MHESLSQSVQQLLCHRHLTAEQVCTCIGAIMDGKCDPVDIAAFLTAMSAKGPVAQELVGAATAMRARASRIRTERSPLLDTCGTGGDQLHTFNISTATAIVAAACGINVAKHGNRSVSSSSGSADVLEALGVNINLTSEQSGKCLDAIGIAFCFAPLLHGAMKHAAPVRRQLGFPTIFNLLGPLTNPAGADFQLLGAGTVEKAELLATALSQLGGRRSLVVCGNNQLDEVCLWGPTTVFDVSDGRVTPLKWLPEDFQLERCDVSQLTVQGATESADVIRRVLQGESSAAFNIVAANTAAALVACERVPDVLSGARLASDVIISGAALEKLHALIRWTQEVS